MYCVVCGAYILDEHPHIKFCSDFCRRRYKANRAEIDAKAESKPAKMLDDWIREAAECGLDYGNYRALIERGSTFEELKARNGGASHSKIHRRSDHFREYSQL